ncbi:geranylgeranylglycerol-phosphate geranylgeranyltransferase [Parasediminibacterium sp. JCM 36343]|uniref:geranylgeranylglycerol-phosphate geranylgeranyltransferase n=1 Tax=Parasediminibacterium sp. JCM 36343 TaxID=3374279 RepID=UPI00397BF60B
MKTIVAFFRLARWSNLLFIVLTQWMFIYCIVAPIFQAANVQPHIHGQFIFLLILSYVLVGAGGYIINDYFDLNIDQINKPDKVVIDRYIGRRWAIVFHICFTVASILIGIYVDLQTHVHFLGFANLVNGIFLFVYSLSLKKKLLVGNVMIAFLLAWVIVAVTCCEADQFTLLLQHRLVNTQKLLRYTILYGGFAFIVNLIREAVKDMEDVEGDRKYGCRTMPIAWGINATKVFVAVWLVVLIAMLVLLQFYAIQFGWWFFSLYCILVVVVPLVIVFKKLFKAQTPKDYHAISSLIKIVMLTGILSMVFFKIYS